MERQHKVVSCKRMSEEELTKINVFLKDQSLFTPGASYVQYDDGTEEIFLGIKKISGTFSPTVVGRALQRKFGYKNLVVEGIRVD